MPYFKAFLRLSLQAILKNSVAIHWNFLWCAWGRLAEFLGFLRLCLNFCDKVCLNLWIATLTLLARNDGQRKRTLSFCNDGAFCHFEPFVKRRKIHTACHFERSALAQSDQMGCKAQAAAKKSTQIKRKLTILGYFANAQYDKTNLVWQIYAVWRIKKVKFRI